MPSAAAPSAIPSRLTGSHLTWARSAWLMLVALILVQHTASMVVRYQELRQVCTASEVVCHTEPRRFTAAEAAEMAAFGLSLPRFAALELVKWLGFSGLWFAVGSLIFFRRPNELIALLVSFFLMSFPSTWDGLNVALVRAYPALQVPVSALQSLAGLSLILFVALFPSGRFVPRWTRWLTLAYVLIAFMPATLFSRQPWWPRLDNLLLAVNMLGLAALVAALFIRYRRYSTALEQERIKWVVFGLALGVVLIGLMVGLALSRIQIGPTEGPWPDLVSELVYQSVVALIPASIGLAILRHRLWDIDVIIRRTLVYSALSAVLGLAYFGSVVVLQGVFSAVTGESRSELATVVSTLAIAALFGPLRARVQRTIDRRFYRKKYDAARTLAAFGAQARDVVEMEQLTGQLVRVVDETMRPVSVSLWVRPGDNR